MTKKPKALTIVKGELSAARNENVAVSVPGETALNLSLELNTLQAHLAKATTDKKLHLPAIVGTIDAISAVQKVSARLIKVYDINDRRTFHAMAIESLKLSLKQHRKRLSLKPLQETLEAMLPEQNDSPLSQSLVLLRRLQAFSGKDNLGAAIALSHSARKLIPLIVAEHRKRGILLNEKEFVHHVINPTIKAVANCLNSNYDDDLAASIIQDFTKDLSSKMG